MDHNLYALPSHEIPSVIQKASVFGGKIAQSSVNNKATRISRMDVDTCGLMFMTFSDDVEIENGRPVAIRLNYRNVSFHLNSEDYSIDGRTLISSLPRHVKALAIRDTERYAFPLDSLIKAEIHRVEKRGVSLSGDVKLVDVSGKGLGFILANAEEQSLMSNDHIWIRNIDGLSLERPLFGRIVYAYERKYRNSIDLKCGVSLDEAIPEDIFNTLQKKCRLVLRA